MSDPLKRPWLPRYSLRTLFVVVTVIGCWLPYEMNWIRHRRELAREGDLVNSIWQNNSGAQRDVLPPLGSTFSQRLLAVFGEPSASRLYVVYIVDDSNLTILTEDGETARDTEDFPKIQRARSLFPESEIVADFIQREWIEGPDAHCPDLKGLISE